MQCTTNWRKPLRRTLTSFVFYCTYKKNYRRKLLQTTREEETISIFSTIAATRLGTRCITSKIWIVEEASFLLSAERTVSSHIEAHKRRSRQVYLLAARMNTAAWSSNERCRWWTDVILENPYDFNICIASGKRLFFFGSRLQCLSHTSFRAGMCVGEWTHPYFAIVNIKLFHKQEQYIDTVETLTVITVVSGRSSKLVFVAPIHCGIELREV